MAVPNILFGPNNRPNSVSVFGRIVVHTPNTNNSRCAAAARLFQPEASKTSSPVSQIF